MTPDRRPPPLWPLALAFAASLFLMRTEEQLYLLAIIIAALCYAAARTFAAATAPSASPPRHCEARSDAAIHAFAAMSRLAGRMDRHGPCGPRDDGETVPFAMTDDKAACTMNRAAETPALTLFVPTTPDALLAVGALCVLFATVPFSSLPSTSLVFAWILGLFPLGYLLGLTALARGARWQRLELIAAAWIGFVAIWGVVEWLRFGDRSNGPFLDYNAFGALFYLAVPPAFVALAQAQSRRAHTLLIGFLALALWALFATCSRGATGILLLILGPLVAGLRRTQLPWRAPAAILLTLTGLAYGVVRYAPTHPVTREVVHLATDQSTQDRLTMWRSAIAMWRERPLLGQGLASYKLHYLHYRSPAEITSTGDLAHNDYIQLLAEGGPLLPALLILAGIGTLILALRLWRRLGPASTSAERRAALAGWATVLPVLGLFLHASVNFIFYVVPLALMAGLMLARARHAAGPLPLRQIRLAAHPRLAGVAYVLVASLAVSAITLDWLAAQAFNPANHWPVFAERRANPLDRYQMASAFVTLRPHHVGVQQALTIGAMDLALANRDDPTGLLWAGIALQHARDWLAASRGNPYAYSAMGQLLWHYPALDTDAAPPFLPSAEANLRRAIENDWINAEHYLILARYYEAEHHPDLALATLLSALRWARVPQVSDAGVEAWKRLFHKAMELADQIHQTAVAVAMARIVAQIDPENAMAQHLLTAAAPAFAIAPRPDTLPRFPQRAASPAPDIDTAWTTILGRQEQAHTSFD